MIFRKAFVAISIVPLIALALQLAAWLRWGIDLPYMDDWRILGQGDAGSIALSDLFRPANDTIYATGKFLDAMAVRWIGYNTIAYQFLSMAICFGFLLHLQYILLRDGVRDTVLVACVYFATIFMLQTGSYWSLQNIAYHQAIPLIALLACLAIQLSSIGGSVVRAGLIATIGTIGGLTYISGAFAVATAAISSALFAWRVPVMRSKMIEGAIGFAVAAVATLPIQLWVILIHQQGHIHRPEAQWSMPWEWEFWAFMLGLVSHAFSIHFPPGPFTTFSLLLSICLLAGLLAPAIWIFIRLFVRERNSADNASYIYLTLTAAIGVYAVLVVASRATLGADPEAGWVDYFVRGGSRFHFFWLTILIPWALALWLRPIHGHWHGKAAWSAGLAGLAILAIALPYSRGSLDYDTYYRNAASARSEGFDCIQEQLLAGGPIWCTTVHPGEITKEVRLARELNLTFAHYLLFPDEVSSNFVLQSTSPRTVAEWISLPLPDRGSIVPENGTLERSGDALVLAGQLDSRIVVYYAGEQARTLASCRELRITGSVNASQGDIVQMFFLENPSGSGFSEKASVTQVYSGGAIQPFELTAQSHYGFGAAVRVDPGTPAQRYELQNVSVSCR